MKIDSNNLVSPISFSTYIVYIPQYDRSDELIQELEELGIRPLKVKSLSKYDDLEIIERMDKGANFYRVTNGRDLVSGEIGCSYGHLKVWMHFLLEGGEWALILEDDARISSPDIPFAYLMSGTAPKLVNLTEAFRSIPFFFQKRNSFSIKMVMPSLFTSAYIINRKAAQKYLRNFLRYGITSVADWPYPQPHGIEFLLTKRPYFRQANTAHQSMTIRVERQQLQIESNHSTLSMPIGTIELINRMWQLRSMGFDWKSIFWHEVVLRFRVRLNLVLRAFKKG